MAWAAFAGAAMNYMASRRKSGGGGGSSYTPTGFTTSGFDTSYGAYAPGAERSEADRRSEQLAKLRAKHPFITGATFKGEAVGPPPAPRVHMRTSAERLRNLSAVSETFRGKSRALGGLLAEVRPGMGRMTTAAKERTAAIREVIGEQRERLSNRERRAIGDLKEDLARRRIGGSSFAGDAVSRMEAEFAGEERALSAEERLAESESAQFEAETILREMEMTRSLISEQADAAMSASQVFLANEEFEANLSAQLASGATSAIQSHSAVQMQLAAQREGARLDMMMSGAGLAAGYLSNRGGGSSESGSGGGSGSLDYSMSGANLGL